MASLRREGLQPGRGANDCAIWCILWSGQIARPSSKAGFRTCEWLRLGRKLQNDAAYAFGQYRQRICYCSRDPSQQKGSRLSRDPSQSLFLPRTQVRTTSSRSTNNSNCRLAAPACTPAAHAPVAAPVPRHDAAAEAAAWRIAQVHDARQRIGGVH